MAVRGSPAKGVGWGNWREGSNPSFSATKERSQERSFAYTNHVSFFLTTIFRDRMSQYLIEFSSGGNYGYLSDSTRRMRQFINEIL